MHIFFHIVDYVIYYPDISRPWEIVDTLLVRIDCFASIGPIYSISNNE